MPRPWFLENLDRNGVGFINSMSRWQLRRFRFAVGLGVAMMLLWAAALYFASASIMALLFPSAANPSSPVPASPPWYGWLVVAVPAMLPILFLLIGGRRQRLRSIVKAARDRACPNCLYDLSFHPVDRCPECAQRVVYDALPVLWNDALSSGTRFGKVSESTGFDDRGRSIYERRLMGLQLLLSLLIPFGSFLPFWLWFSFARHSSGGVNWSIVLIAFPAALLSMAVIAGPLAMLIRVRLVRLRGALRTSNGAACPACLHDLSASPVQLCSECGQRVDYEGLQRAWNVRMKIMRIKPEQPKPLRAD